MVRSKAEKQREMLEERQRIDATIAVIDAAKRKALAQREEYGKFLKWKVSMQHRERKQREAEERDLRSRIDARLKAVLEEHRERKQEEVKRWKTFAEDRPPAMRESSGALAARLQRQAEEQQKAEEKQRKKDEIHRRLRATPHSAPSGAQKANNSQRGGPGMTHTGYEPVVPRRGGPPTVSNTNNDDEGGSPTHAFANEHDFAAAFPLPDVPEAGQASVVVPARAGASGLDSLTVDQAKAITAIDKDRKRVARNGRLVTDMYEVAKSRKLYSTARVMADPPADFMIGADLMRYIPADVMGSVDASAAPKPQASNRVDAQTFFITQNNDTARQLNPLTSAVTDLDGDADPESRHQHGGGPSPPRGGPKQPNGGRGVSRWKAYDPNAWMQQKLGGDPEALQGTVDALDHAERNRDEERATLQWYKECYEPITKIKKRTERHQSHSWSSVATHKLPPLPAAKFID